MCSVVGYIGKQYCQAFVFDGLARLEYRGYDSAGFACFDEHSQKIECVKASGQLNNLVDRIKSTPIDGFLGIGHTRWSTHGDFSEKNAHPHFDCTCSISVVHNGIIENHLELKKNLIAQGHVFQSGTDTEVIPHLFESLLADTQDLTVVIGHVVQLLQGAYACIVMLQQRPDVLIAIRKKSPLCIGFGSQETFVASDVTAFSHCANKVFFMPDESYALLYKDRIEVYDYAGQRLPITLQPIEQSFVLPDKQHYEHFMLKEIYEQPTVINRTVQALSALGVSVWDQCGLSVDQIKNFTRIALIGCGTSWHSAKIGQFFFEEISALPVDVYLASEFRYMRFFPSHTTLYILISQSGETADTLEALRLLNNNDMHTVVVTNVAASTMVREARGFLLTHAGIEVSVASTKAFSTQLAVLYWLSHRIAYEKELLPYSGVEGAERDVIEAGLLLESCLVMYQEEIERIVAPRYAAENFMFFLGKHMSYPFAAEGALKLKEISYIFAQTYPIGELKHGPLALIDDSVVVCIFSHQDALLYQKLLSGAHAIKSRGGRMIVFAYEGQDELCSLAETSFVFPKTISSLLGPLVMTGVMQFFAYAIAKERGCPIDKPKNLAKSVTVE